MMAMVVEDMGQLLALSVYFATRAIRVAMLLVLRSDFALFDSQHPAWSLKVFSEMIEA